jgi:hypothetical protein
MSMPNIPRCLYPKCRKDAHSRGLCNTHSARANKYLREGRITEEELIKKGLMEPKKYSTPGRPKDHDEVFLGPLK